MRTNRFPFKCVCRKEESKDTFEVFVMVANIEHVRIIVMREHKAILIKAKQVKGHEPSKLDKYFREDSDKWLMVFFRQLSNMLKAGLPITECLQAIAGTETNSWTKHELLKITNNVKIGNSFSSCVAKQKAIFPDICSMILESGEETGNLDRSCIMISDFFKGKRKNSKQVKGALLQRKITLSMGLGAIVVAGAFIIPEYAEVMKATGIEPNTSMVIVTTTFTFLREYWAFCIGWLLMFKVLVSVVIGKAPDLHKKYYYKIPVIGDLEYKSTMNTFCSTLAMLNDAGSPIQRSIELAARATGCPYIIDRCHIMSDLVQRGHSITDSARQTNCFNPLIEAMLSSGEQSGRLSAMLNSVVEVYESEVETGLEELTEKLQPFILAILAGISVILAYSIVLPQLDVMIGFSRL